MVGIFPECGIFRWMNDSKLPHLSRRELLAVVAGLSVVGAARAADMSTPAPRGNSIDNLDAHDDFQCVSGCSRKASRDQPYAAADVAEQEGMRRRWLEDYLFHDPVTRIMVPYEVWSFADQAPTVMF